MKNLLKIEDNYLYNKLKLKDIHEIETRFSSVSIQISIHRTEALANSFVVRDKKLYNDFFFKVALSFRRLAIQMAIRVLETSALKMFTDESGTIYLSPSTMNFAAYRHIFFPFK